MAPCWVYFLLYYTALQLDREINGGFVFFPGSTLGKRWSVWWGWNPQGVTVTWSAPEDSEPAGNAWLGHFERKPVAVVYRQLFISVFFITTEGSWSALYWTGKMLFQTETWTKQMMQAGDRSAVVCFFIVSFLLYLETIVFFRVWFNICLVTYIQYIIDFFFWYSCFISGRVK